MDDIETHVPRTYFTENRIQVGAVVIQEPAGIVHELRDLFNTAFEDPERRRIRQHDARCLWPERRGQGVNVDIALGACRNLADHIAAHVRRRRIRAVRGVGDDDLAPRRVAARLVVRANHSHAGQFPLGAGHRR